MMVVSLPPWAFGTRMNWTCKYLISSRFFGLALGASLATLAIGCQKDTEIRHYQVPRADKAPPNWRLLGAMIPREDKVWFFRLEGPTKEIVGLKAAFDGFMKSIRFTKKDEENPITWTLPANWEQQPGDKKFRYATLRITTKEGRLDMTVIPLPREGGADSVLRNLIRWRDQLGLDPIPETELGQNAQTIEVQGVPVTLFDITGFQVARRPMFAAGPKENSAPAREPAPLTYQTPPGWKKGPAKSMRLATFVVAENNQQAEVTIIPLGKQAGSLLDNVNRWRGEVNLKPTSAARLADDARPLTVAGVPAHFVDLIGPSQRTLAVMLARGDSTWFFKMKGPADLVGRQKSAFEQFMKSVKFSEEQGN